MPTAAAVSANMPVWASSPAVETSRKHGESQARVLEHEQRIEKLREPNHEPWQSDGRFARSGERPRRRFAASSE